MPAGESSHLHFHVDRIDRWTNRFHLVRRHDPTYDPIKLPGFDNHRMIALVVYHGPTGWGVPLSVEELIDVPPPLERFLPNRGEELIPTLAEQWANQGREQGLAEGIERGIERGALIGTIETCRSILGGSSGSEVLARQPLEELRQLAEQLQSQVRERMTGQ